MKQPEKQNLKISKPTTHTKIKTDKYNNTSPVTWKTTRTAKENGTNANFPNKLAMNYERPHYTTTSLSNYKPTKYETNQDTKPKTE